MESFVKRISYPYIRVNDTSKDHSSFRICRSVDAMGFRPVVVAVICVGLFIIIESLVPKTLATRTSNFNNFRMEDQRTQKRRNYILQRARDKEILGNLDNVGVTYEVDPLEPGRNPEELSAFIVDYANMIDDVVLLDKSVETRTRKRGNIKLEKHNSQTIPDPPCSCNTVGRWEDLGGNTFPKRVDISICDKDQQGGCVAPYKCQEIYYETNLTLVHLIKMPIMRRRISDDEKTLSDLIPQNLVRSNWLAEFKNVSVGCECKWDYTIPI